MCHSVSFTSCGGIWSLNLQGETMTDCVCVYLCVCSYQSKTHFHTPGLIPWFDPVMSFGRSRLEQIKVDYTAFKLYTAMTYKTNLAVQKFEKTCSTKLRNCENAVFWQTFHYLWWRQILCHTNNDLQERDQTRREIMQQSAIAPPVATTRMQHILNCLHFSEYTTVTFKHIPGLRFKQLILLKINLE